MTQNGMPTYADLNDEVRRLRDRLAQFEAAASAPSTRLQDAQDLFQLVFDHLPQSICWKDHNSVFQGCNLPFARSLGMQQPSDLIGKSDYDLTSTELADAYAADDRLVMEGGIAKVNFEEPQLHPDGTMGWLLTSKVPLRKPDGAVVGVL